MRTDAIMKSEGMDALIGKLGMVGAERFIMLLQRESFDYTKWRQNLFEGKTLEQIHSAAARHWEEKR